MFPAKARGQDLINIAGTCSTRYNASVEVYITRHARNRMRRYKVDEESVRAAVAGPELLTPGTFESEHAWRRVDENRWLRVTFKNEGTRCVVITVTPKRKLPGGRHED